MISARWLRKDDGPWRVAVRGDGCHLLEDKMVTVTTLAGRKQDVRLGALIGISYEAAIYETARERDIVSIAGDLRA